MNNFEHHISVLEAQGFQLERGMLIGDGRFARADQIGTRFSTAEVQVDTYTQEAFFETDKSHPVLGDSQEVDGPQGSYLVTELLAG